MNKNKLIYIGLGLTSLLTYAMASVPHTFTANTVAKASEVNENFSSLDNRITSLEKNSNKQNNNDSGNSSNYDSDNCDKPVFTYQYQKISSNIGDEVFIGTNKYKIVAIPFVEFGTNDKYYIKIPKKINSSYVNFSTKYVTSGSNCYPNTIDGFPAKLNNGISYNRSLTIDNNNLSISDRASFYIQIKINQTTMTLFSDIPSSKIYNSTIENNDFDFRDNINWDNLTIQNQLVEDTKKFLNYIDIVKIEN